MTTERARVDRLGPVGVWLGALGWAPAERARAATAQIEEMGYGTLWVGEAHVSKEAFSHAGLLLAASSTLTVATGIANIWVRDATATQAAAATLAEAYPGRFLLGLGASHAPQVDHRGHHYARPLSAMRTYLADLDLAATRYEAPGPTAPPRRVIAALGPRMLELARDATDGAHTYFVPPEHTAMARTVLGATPLLAAEQAVLLDPDPASARARARSHMAFYLHLPNYVNNLLALGFTDDDVADGGSDRLVDAVVAWGDPDAVVARVREHLDAGADHVALQPLGGADDLGVAELRALAAHLPGR